jgi:G3E family GTPase
MIPLVLLVGFLGSGKTTFLRKILPLLKDQGLNPSVVINDYQNARVDAATLADLVPVVEAVSGSCVCCGSRDEFLDLLEKISLPEKGILLVETNGTTDPVELLEILAMDPRAGRFGSPIQISLIDAKRWQKRFWNNELERMQVGPAAWLHFTREDEVPVARMREVREGVRKWNGTGFAIGPEEFSEFLGELQKNGRLHSGGKSGLLPKTKSSGGGHQHAHGFSAVQISLRPLLSREIFSRWLDSFSDRILRAKGLVAFEEEGGKRFVFQKVPGEAASFIPLSGSTPLEPLAVLIGAGLSEIELLEKARRAGVAE